LRARPLLVAVVLLAFAFAPLLAAIPQPAFAAVSCGDTLTTSTTLTSSIGPCPGNGITIGSDGVTLNCTGQSVSGPSASAAPTTYGIDLAGVKGVTVENCNVVGFTVAFELSGSSNDLLKGNTATDSGEGFSLYLSDGNRVTNDYAEGGGNGIGFSVSSSSGNTIARDMVSLVTDGFNVVGRSSDNTIDWNAVSAYLDYGFLDMTTGSHTSGTANIYSSDACLNFLNRILSSPSGLCSPNVPITPEFPLGITLVFVLLIPLLLMLRRSNARHG